jgi:hypothetical protein
MAGQAEERQWLRGSSTLHLEDCEPFMQPPTNLQRVFSRLVVPLFAELPELGAPKEEGELWSLFLWATGAVASYSFELGDGVFHVRACYYDHHHPDTGWVCCNQWIEFLSAARPDASLHGNLYCQGCCLTCACMRSHPLLGHRAMHCSSPRGRVSSALQGMVPMWDLLNHVTGRCNVRLHHDAQQHCLQMIATAPIPAGTELINCYGELSNGELLRRCASSLAVLSGRSTRAFVRWEFLPHPESSPNNEDCCTCPPTRLLWQFIAVHMRALSTRPLRWK